MNLRRQLLLTFGLQGAGAVSVLLATLWLGASLGPEVQGIFSRTKSEIEFIAAVAMFGLPQALFFHVQSGRLSAGSALRWVRWNAVLALLVGALYALVQHSQAESLLPLVLGAAVGASVAHGELRALLLVRERTEWFSILTALPQILVLAGVGCAIAWGVTAITTWFALFAFAYGVAAALAWPRRSTARVVVVGIETGWRSLADYGLAAWLAASLSSAASLAALKWVEHAEGVTALGQFTMALTLTQVPLTPINYAAPLLFRRWMEHSGARASQYWAGLLFGALLGCSLLVWVLALPWPDLGLGAAYMGATRALALLLAGAAAEAASRVLIVDASASGLPWIAARAEVARCCVLGIGWLLPLPHGLLPVCAIWALAAATAALVVVWHARLRSHAAGKVR